MDDLIHITPMGRLTLDDLWREAETLGFVRVWTTTNFGDTAKTGYDVKIIGRVKNSKIEVERKHTSLECAFSDAINEAREMGLGEQQ